MPELNECIQRVTELRQKALTGEIDDNEIREGIGLIAEIRAMRAGKQVGKSKAESEAEAKKSLSEFF